MKCPSIKISVMLSKYLKIRQIINMAVSVNTGWSKPVLQPIRTWQTFCSINLAKNPFSPKREMPFQILVRQFTRKNIGEKSTLCNVTPHLPNPVGETIIWILRVNPLKNLLVMMNKKILHMVYIYWEEKNSRMA